MEEKSQILQQKVVTEENKMKIEEIEQHIRKEIYEKEFQQLKTVVGESENALNTNMWRELKKAYPKVNKTLPTGVTDILGKVVINPNDKNKVTLKHRTNGKKKDS